jgi:hypothetical protein
LIGKLKEWNAALHLQAPIPSSKLARLDQATWQADSKTLSSLDQEHNLVLVYQWF